MKSRASTYPPRWQPSFIRWHQAPVSLPRAWAYTLGAVRATWRHTIFDLAADLPGHDDIIAARAPIARFLIVRNPEYARHILVTNQDNYVKGVEYDLLGVAFGRGLVTELDETLWRRHRRIMQPVFAKRHVDGFAPQMTDVVTEMADRWEREHGDGEPLDVAAAMKEVTLGIIGRTMFGAQLSGPLAEQMQESFARLLRIFGQGLIAGSGHPARWIANAIWRLGRHRGEPQDSRLVLSVLRWFVKVGEPSTFRGLIALEQFIDRLIADYHATPATERGESNLLALLLEAEDPETGDRFTDDEVREELMTFLGAGHETTASGLAWTWLLLSRHPEARERLRAELGEVLGGRVPGADDVPQLLWTNAVIQESMRLYPPIMGLTRVAVNDDVVGGVRIPAGATVAILIHGIHHHPGVWEAPRRFDPERFMPDAPSPSSRQALMPFGAGKRMCIAAGFGSLEAVLIVATLAQRFNLDLIPQEPIRRENTFTGGPEGAIWMELEHSRPESVVVP